MDTIYVRKYSIKAVEHKQWLLTLIQKEICAGCNHFKLIDYNLKQGAVLGEGEGGTRPSPSEMGKDAPPKQLVMRFTFFTYCS